MKSIFLRTKQKPLLSIKTTFLILIFLFVSAERILCQPLVVADHRSVEEFDLIPDQWIEIVKTSVVQYVGQSHGRQLPHGLELLYQSDPRLKVSIGPDPDTLDKNALRVVRSQYNGSRWSGENVDDNMYWSTENGRQLTELSASEAIAGGFPFDVSIWCWCWDITNPASFFSQSSTFGDEHIGWYVDAINGFNRNNAINRTVFVYHTSITDCPVGEGGWRVTRYNDWIRNAASLNRGVLFDQADIENWNITNTSRRVDTWNDHTLYLRHPDYDEEGNPDGIPDFKPGHTNEALCIRKAKAFWWLLARLSGWTPPQSVHSGDIKGLNIVENTLVQPNPFNSNVTLTYKLKKEARITIKILSLDGRLTKTLYEGMAQTGENSIIWDGRNDKGRNVGSGLYIGVLSTGYENVHWKMVLLR